ncbi:hypothetical protein [Aeromicrobium sp.]|uniref:hypothetical protein n=1 Tax=Aeromicrobium sp. TaxID=1871063 RepID=UPI0028B0A637|nr:hypothetical protein [Aeromicrobium sp.]
MARTKRSRIPDLGRPEITELEFGRTTHRVAAVEPMDVDGVRTMTFGTIAWGIVAIALLPFWGNLQDQGRTWWLWTAIAGLGLGLMGIEYCKRRRDALQQATEASTATEDLPPEAVTPAPAPAPAPKTVSPKKQDSIQPADPAPVAEQAAPTPTERPVGRRRRN